MKGEKYRVIIAGGGTGGHLFPGIAVAEEFKNRRLDVDVLFMGTERGIEAKVLPRERYNVKLIKADGFVRASLKRKIRGLLRFVISLFETYFFLKKMRPDVMIGTGGYVSFLPVMVSRWMSVPTVILEQNTLPGLSNRILSRIVKRICVTYEGSMPYFPKNKTFLTGNPVRERILRGNKQAGIKLFSLREGMFTVFIFGGSSGAKSINHAAIEALEHLLGIQKEIQFLHQTGEADYEFVRKSYRSYGYSGTVTPFIFQMPEAYAVADLIVSRAGATTLAEITAIGVPSILIPYPYAASSHQEMNALRLSQSGAAVMLRENELSGKTLAEGIGEIFFNKELRDKMKRECKSLGKTSAAKRVVDIALSISKSKSLSQ